LDESEHDVLAYITFPAQHRTKLHRTKLHRTNPLERLNKEVKRRADVVGIFPDEASITRLIGAVLSSKMMNGRSSAATGRSREWPNLHRRRLTPIRPNFHHQRPPDRWPPQTPPRFTPA
jgi:putative transposase